MQNTIQSLFQKERFRQIRLALALALITSLVVLAGAFAIQRGFFDDESSTNDLDGDPNNDPPLIDPPSNSFVLDLGTEMELRMVNDNVAHFQITGNITSAVHPNLIFSTISNLDQDSNWEVNAQLWQI